MTNPKCDVNNVDFLYFYCPSYPAAVTFAILFSLTSIAHIYQAYRYRKQFATVLIMGGAWEVAGYAIRSVSIQNPYTSGFNTAQMLLILLAPLWINAFIYMLVGRMIHFFLDEDRIFGIKARKMTMIFVIFDIIAFLVQGTGGSMTVSDTLSTALNGLHIYTAGVALQIAFNAFFLAVIVKFHIIASSVFSGSRSIGQIFSLNTRGEAARAMPSFYRFEDCLNLLRLVYGTLLLVLFRNFYRLAEFASGLENTIVRHEWYAYVFDAVPMFVAMVILNVFYPGRRLQGTRCDFSEENRERKQAKKDKKAEKKKISQSSIDAGKAPVVAVHEVATEV